MYHTHSSISTKLNKEELTSNFKQNPHFLLNSWSYWKGSSWTDVHSSVFMFNPCLSADIKVWCVSMFGYTLSCYFYFPGTDICSLWGEEELSAQEKSGHYWWCSLVNHHSSSYCGCQCRYVFMEKWKSYAKSIKQECSWISVQLWWWSQCGFLHITEKCIDKFILQCINMEWCALWNSCFELTVVY